MRHFAVKVGEEVKVVEADEIAHAIMQVLEPVISKAKLESEEVFCPCQWGSPCPSDRINCGECYKEMRKKVSENY